MECPFPKDGPCYYRKSASECGRQNGVECLKPYRDGLKKNAEAEFLRETASLFRNSDPSRCAELERIAERIRAGI